MRLFTALFCVVCLLCGFITGYVFRAQRIETQHATLILGPSDPVIYASRSRDGENHVVTLFSPYHSREVKLFFLYDGRLDFRTLYDPSRPTIVPPDPGPRPPIPDIPQPLIPAPAPKGVVS